MTDDARQRVSPRRVLERIGMAIPEECKVNVVIIGSLAAGYQLLGRDEQATGKDCPLQELAGERVGQRAPSAYMAGRVA